MAYDKQNAVHCIGLLYVTVAYLPDQNVSMEEKTQMAERLTGWLRAFEWDVNQDGVVDENDAAKIFVDDVLPYFSEIGTQGLVEEVHRIGDFLLSQTYWNDATSMSLIKQFFLVATADGIYTKSASNIINIIAGAFRIRENEIFISMMDEMNELAVDKENIDE